MTSLKKYCVIRRGVSDQAPELLARHLPPDTMYVNTYGPIEITVACTYYVVDREFSDDEKLPVGFPMRDAEILIFNEQNQLTKVDEPGEICVRGSSLALGYYNNAERTAKGFVQNPLNPHYPEWISTGPAIPATGTAAAR